MGSISKLISTKIGDYVIGTISKRIGYNLEMPFFSPAGMDSVPLPDDKQFIEKKDGTGNFVILGSLMISQGAKAGEMIIYSRDSNGAVKGKVYVNNAGEIVLNDGVDYAVTHTQLQTALTAYANSVNLSLAAKLDGGGTTGTTSVDISSSKVEKVRL